VYLYLFFIIFITFICGKYVTDSAVYNTVDERKRFYERKVREREIEGERKGCYNTFIQDPDPE
jgi:hypothetical protein